MSYNQDLLGGTLMSQPAVPGTLYHALGQVPDHRSPRGQSYPLPSLLLLLATAMLCGARSLYAIAQWGRDYNHLAPLLGFTKPDPKHPGTVRTPCVSELHTVLAFLDVRRFEQALADWIMARGVADLDDRVVHIDGKRLRGSQGHQLPGVHLLAAYCPDVEGVLAQLRVEDTNEHKAALELLQLIPLRGTLVTGDAAFTQRDFCQAIIDGGGDYFLPVKDNQPALKEAIETGFRRAFSPPGAARAAASRSAGREPG
jgi:hypothetical protein